MANFGWSAEGPKPIIKSPKLSTTATSSTFLKGMVMKYSSTGVVAPATAKTDETVCIIVGENKTDRGNYKTSSERIDVVMPGCYVWVQAVTGDTWTQGLTVYMDDSVDAMVTSDADTASGIPIGNYIQGEGVGEHESFTTTASGDAILIYFTGYRKDLGV